MWRLLMGGALGSGGVGPNPICRFPCPWRPTISLGCRRGTPLSTSFQFVSGQGIDYRTQVTGPGSGDAPVHVELWCWMLCKIVELVSREGDCPKFSIKLRPSTAAGKTCLSGKVMLHVSLFGTA